MKFFTQEMSEAAQKLVEESPAIQEKLKDVNMKFILMVTDCPGDEDRQMALGSADGKIVESILTIKPAPSDMRDEPVDTSVYAAKVIGPYETIAAVTSKKLPMLAALGSMRIEGDMAQLIGNMTGLTTLLDIFGGMPGLEF